MVGYAYDLEAFAIVILTVLIFAVFSAWLYFLIYTIISFKRVPKLESANEQQQGCPKVSVILPARDEEQYIAKCLDSLINQSYPNFEIVIINDSSSDRTGEIIQRYHTLKSKVVIAINAKPKPEVGQEEWTGKNWACYQGYLKSTGEILLFTDADTVHSRCAVSLAVTYLIKQNLDALTAIPKILSEDNIWIKTILPLLWALSYAKYSALRANNPKSKIGYFFGSFFIITRKTYESVGTHKSVKTEIVEDGALGRKVKEEKFKIKVVRGEKYIDAVWARDFNTLWHGLRRLMIPLYQRKRTNALLMTVSSFLLLLLPFIVLPFLDGYYRYNSAQVYDFLLLVDIMAIIMLFAFISSILDAPKKNAVNWKDRKYTVKESH